jgi:hypothetical protein
MKKVVALIYGGDSSEAEVSVKSGRHVSAHLDRNLFEVHEVMLKGRDWNVLTPSGGSVQIDKSDFSYTDGGVKVSFDVALIMIHRVKTDCFRHILRWLAFRTQPVHLLFRQFRSINMPASAICVTQA